VELDALFLSRLQFALTVGFHFIFPPLSIGLATLIVIFEWLGWQRNDQDYLQAGEFFGKILGLTFAVGVATGIVMEFEFGTNWAQYSKFVGDVFGAPLAAEAVFAFFLESTFLGLYLFGRRRLSKAVHWFSSLMVAFGSILSAFWIIAANSWQQTPAGYVIRNSRAELTSFWEALLNPSTPHRFFHTIIACFIAGAFLVAGISAYYLIRKQFTGMARKSLRVSLILAFVCSVVIAAGSGHHHAIQVERDQPEKFAAMEGVIHGGPRAPMTVFGIPTEDPPRLHYSVEIPGMLSWLLAFDVEKSVQGLEDLRAKGRPTPPFVITFLSFHIMIGLGTLFIGLTGLGLLLMVHGSLYTSRWFLALLVLAVPLPIVACEFGWIAAEVGHQPWAVYGLLLTKDAFSFNVTGLEVLLSLVLFGLIYLFLGALFLYLLLRKVFRGPEPVLIKEVE